MAQEERMADPAVDTPVDTGATITDAEVPQVPEGEAPVTPEAKPAPGNALDGDDKPTAAPQDWPEDWRTRAAGEDAKVLKRLERYSSPKAMAEALISAQDRISKGDIGPKKPGKDATPEDLAKWREAQGIPEAPEGYFENIPNGLVIGDDDRPLFDSFTKAMHEENLPPSAVHKAMDWYYKDVVEAQEQAQYDAEREARQTTEDTLREEYGSEYRAQVTSVRSLLSSLPDGAGQLLMDARGPDGISLFNKPEVVRAMVQLANEINPAASVIPGATKDGSVGDRLQQLRDLQKTDPKKYWSDAVQKEELDLIAAQKKIQARG